MILPAAKIMSSANAEHYDMIARTLYVAEGNS